MPELTPDSATSRETSFVMSITDSDGRAAAIEYGTSTVVMPARPPWAAGSGRPPARPRSPRRRRSRRSASRAAVARTSSSGVDAPAVRPIVSWPATSVLVERALAVDERRLRAGRLRDLDEPLRVRARLRADHEHERRALRRPSPSRRPGGSASRSRCRRRAAAAASPWCSPSASTIGATSSSDSVVCVITATGLSVSSALRLLGRLDHDGGVRPLAERPDHLDVIRVADERDEMAAVGVAPRLGVHLVHERAGRVDDPQAAPLAFSFTAGATPCAERTQISPSGISSSSSTKTAPSFSSRRTTCSLWTIWWRT